MPLNNVDPLQPNHFYHIYNRAVGSEQLFLSTMDYGQFLFKWQKYISPVLNVYAYCLMPNHFHFLVGIKPVNEVREALKVGNDDLSKAISNRFGNFFSSYAMSFNRRNQRKGKLFMLPYRRKGVESAKYYSQMVYYIHRNPLHHGMLIDPGKWEFSSYQDIIGDGPTWIHRSEVLNWFGGKHSFIKYHEHMNLFSE